ncbi:MAG: sensor domain-containing diguanylate cyclase, partial [Desulfobacteraceae bacterium]|nr:sensor domain-containing diguanylate cyclase [Desulfobacteraceae bacterium]
APLSIGCGSLAGLALAAAGAGRAWWRRDRPAAGRGEEIADLLLWTAALWMGYRLLAGQVAAAILLPACWMAWIVASRPPAVAWPPMALALAMEAALTFLAGRQPPVQLAANLAGWGAAAAALRLFARSRVHRRQLRQAFARDREETATREYARDLGLLADRTNALGAFEAPLDGGRSTVESLAASFDLQLELLRQGLDVTTVAVLWPDAAGKELRLRAAASARTDLLPGPFPPGQGIAGALLRTGEELALAPVPPGYDGLPYYRNTKGVGSIYVLRIPGEAGKTEPPGLLCVDRPQRESWDESAGRVLRLAARKVGLEVAMARRLEDMDRDRHAIRKVCFGLQELNGALGLETAFAASMKAIRGLVHADFAAFSLLEEDQHRVVHAEGEGAEKVIGLAFGKGEGLVGQVLKVNHPLPAGGAYRGPAPVFSRAQPLADFGSLLVVPLRKEEGEPFGALVVAAREQGVFTDTRLQILELIATQVAVKIDLAQAHERINNMATTDGLTGLANHRTFQHGFEIMLSRAERCQGPLALLLGDIDHFKQVNDTYGHPFGDQVLQAVAGVIGSAVRRADLAARYGGEEFAVLLDGTDLRQGRQVAERIRQKVQALSFRHQGEQVTPTISLGMAVFPEDGGDKPLLISRADQALYHAKATGRNRLAIWGELPEEAKRRPAN